MALSYSVQLKGEYGNWNNDNDLAIWGRCSAAHANITIPNYRVNTLAVPLIDTEMSDYDGIQQAAYWHAGLTRRRVYDGTNSKALSLLVEGLSSPVPGMTEIWQPGSVNIVIANLGGDFAQGNGSRDLMLHHYSAGQTTYLIGQVVINVHPQLYWRRDVERWDIIMRDHDDCFLRFSLNDTGTVKDGKLFVDPTGTYAIADCDATGCVNTNSCTLSATATCDVKILGFN